VNEEKKFKYLETLTLNQDAFENIWFCFFALWVLTITRLSDSLYMPGRLSLMALLTEVCLTKTARMIVPLFLVSFHPVFLHPVHQQFITGRPLTICCTFVVLIAIYVVLCADCCVTLSAVSLSYYCCVCCEENASLRSYVSFGLQRVGLESTTYQRKEGSYYVYTYDC